MVLKISLHGGLKSKDLLNERGDLEKGLATDVSLSMHYRKERAPEQRARLQPSKRGSSTDPSPAGPQNCAKITSEVEIPHHHQCLVICYDSRS